MEPTIETRDEFEWELRDEELDRMGGDVRAARFSAGTAFCPPPSRIDG